MNIKEIMKSGALGNVILKANYTLKSFGFKNITKNTKNKIIEEIDNVSRKILPNQIKNRIKELFGDMSIEKLEGHTDKLVLTDNNFNKVFYCIQTGTVSIVFKKTEKIDGNDNIFLLTNRIGTQTFYDINTGENSFSFKSCEKLDGNSDMFLITDNELNKKFYNIKTGEKSGLVKSNEKIKGYENMYLLTDNYGDKKFWNSQTKKESERVEFDSYENVGGGKLKLVINSGASKIISLDDLIISK